MFKIRTAFAALSLLLVASISGAYLPNKVPSIERILISEGSEYTNDPQDPGGPTKYGITIFDTRLYVKKNATAADVKALTRDTAIRIYDAKYWNALNCDDLPSGLDYTLVDYGVNSGIARAGRVLRQALGMPTNDWHVTPEVIAAVNKRAATALIRAENNERLAFLERLPTWQRFGHGWEARVRSVNAISLKLAGIPVITTSNWKIPSNPFVRFIPLQAQEGPGKSR